jgi:hypothetical protein
MLQEYYEKWINAGEKDEESSAENKVLGLFLFFMLVYYANVFQLTESKTCSA